MIDGKKTCAITGTSGYVGRRIRDHFIENGWTVYELKHDVRGVTGDRFVPPYSLEGDIHPGILDILQKSDVLIHCAYDFRLVDSESIWQTNVNGSLRLLNAAKSAGVKNMIVVSTMSAFDGCKSIYGMAKLAIEKEAQKIGAIIVRPGLVFGRNAGGMVGTLERLISLSRIVPLIGNGCQVLYLAHENDLCRLMFKLANEPVSNLSKPIIAASEKGRTFRDILQVLASARGTKLRFIPVPWRLVWSGVKLLELVKLRIGLRSDSIISLVNLDPKPSFDLTKDIGVTFREFSSQTAAS